MNLTHVYVWNTVFSRGSLAAHISPPRAGSLFGSVTVFLVEEGDIGVAGVDFSCVPSPSGNDDQTPETDGPSVRARGCLLPGVF